MDTSIDIETIKVILYLCAGIGSLAMLYQTYRSISLEKRFVDLKDSMSKSVDELGDGFLETCKSFDRDIKSIDQRMAAQDTRLAVAENNIEKVINTKGAIDAWFKKVGEVELKLERLLGRLNGHSNTGE